MKTGTRTQAASEGRNTHVVAWRRRQLLAAGFDRRRAQRITRDCGFDLHGILDLVAQGCPTRLAESILLPLDGEHRRC